jgi:hypothetical protein
MPLQSLAMEFWRENCCSCGSPIHAMDSGAPGLRYKANHQRCLQENNKESHDDTLGGYRGSYEFLLDPPHDRNLTQTMGVTMSWQSTQRYRIVSFESLSCVNEY